MSDIAKNWSTTTASNTSLFPEGMAPSALNDGMRSVQASLKQWYLDAEWIDCGSVNYVSTTSFTIPGDWTSRFHKGRRIKFMNNSAADQFGTIDTASYSTRTGVVVSMDTGNLVSSLSSVAVGIVSFNNTSKPDITVSYSVNSGTLGGATATDSSVASNIIKADSSGKISPSWINAGGILQSGRTCYTGTAAISATFTIGASPLQKTEGTEVATCVISAKYPNSILEFNYCLSSWSMGGTLNNNDYRIAMGVFKAAETTCVYNTVSIARGGHVGQSFAGNFYKTASTTLTTTYSFKLGTSDGTAHLYPNAVGSPKAGLMISWKEIAQ